MRGRHNLCAFRTSMSRLRAKSAMTRSNPRTTLEKPNLLKGRGLDGRPKESWVIFSDSGNSEQFCGRRLYIRALLRHSRTSHAGKPLEPFIQDFADRARRHRLIFGALPAERWREMPTKIVEVAPETATAAVFEGTQRELRKRCSDLEGPISSEEFPALSREDDRIEVVSLAEYLSDTHKGRWC